MRTRRTRLLVGSAAGMAALALGAASVVAMTGTAAQNFSQDSAGIAGAAEVGDYFASSVAVGDFDGDGYADVVAGTPFEDHGTIRDGGAIHVLYGSASGVTAARDRTLHQGTPGIPGGVEAGDLFGQTVASGDFDADGFDDVAVSVAGEAYAGRTGAGMVQVIYGGSQGLSGSRSASFTPRTPGVPGASTSGDAFGAALAIGDLDRDGFDDLAVGIPGKTLRGRSSAGAVNVLFGSGRGLRGAGARIVHQGTTGVPNGPEGDDEFGSALAIGDFDRNGHNDLAVGVPGESFGTAIAVGLVHVFPGSGTGPRFAKGSVISQAKTGVPGSPEIDDRFGAALATGDFNGDGRDDLAVGTPGEAFGATPAVGVVTVVPGRKNGLTGRGSYNLAQSTPRVEGGPEAGDEFGLAIAVGDFNANGHDDLAVGAPGEAVGTRVGAGVTHVLYGKSGGLDGSYSRLYSPGIGDLAGRSKANAGFGRALATGDINGDGRDDLVVGRPGARVSGHDVAGGLVVLFG